MSGAQQQALRFIVIGAASTGLYFGLLMALQPLVSSILLLTAICYGLSMGFNFLAQGLFTFNVRKLSSRQMARYIAMHGCAMMVNSVAMATMVNIMGVHIIISQIIVTGLITVGTFTLSRSWVYA